MNSPVSPAEIVAVILAELLFGIGFNAFVVWEQDHPLWPTALNVVIGTAVTVLIPTLAWWPIWKISLLLTVCFAASGLPMFIGSARRKVISSHKRHAWPTAAAQARDNAVGRPRAMSAPSPWVLPVTMATLPFKALFMPGTKQEAGPGHGMPASMDLL